MPQTPERKKIQQREYCARPEVKAKRAAVHAEWMEKNKSKKQASEARRRLERRASCLVATAASASVQCGIARHVVPLHRLLLLPPCEFSPGNPGAFFCLQFFCNSARRSLASTLPRCYSTHIGQAIAGPATRSRDNDHHHMHTE